MSWYLTLGIDSTVACIHGNTAQMQRGNDLALFWSSREGAPDARGRRVGVQEGRDGVVLDLPVKMMGARRSWKKAAAMAGLELLLLVGTRDDKAKKVCSGA